MAEMQVINRNDATFKGRYAGTDYLFPPGKASRLPEEAAAHIFGLGEKDKTRALNNLGILIGTVTYQAALTVYAKFEFHKGVTVFAEQQPLPVDEPAPPKKGPEPDEQEEEEESESGGRPGAHKRPGGKSEGEEARRAMLSTPSDDLKPLERKHRNW